MFLLYLPIGIEKTKLKKYCILLEFDKNNRLIRHASARGSDNNPSLGEELGCQAVFAAQTENLRRAIRTHCHEADLGNANSQLQIADIYYLGLLNVKKDLTRAYLWYSLAYANGSEVASYRMDDIVKGMSSEQLVLAKKMVEEWEPGMCENALLEGHREFIKQ
jgi:TPR repeat protein